MTEMDPHDRIDLTGPWAGFGFQGNHIFTPEGHHLEPMRHDLVVSDLQHRPGMALDDGGSPAAADAIAALWKALRQNGFQRRIPARVRQNSQSTTAGHG